MLGRSWVNAHNFVYVPKGNGRYATYTVQDTRQLEVVLRPTRPSARRQNTYPCVVTSPQSTESVKIEPLVGTADVGLYLTHQTIVKLGLRYTGLNESTRQGPAKIYSGVSLRFDADQNGGLCSYTFIQVFELPESQRTVSKADPSANVKRDGIIGLSHLTNHVVLSLKGDVFLIDRQTCLGSVIEDVFPPLTPYRLPFTPPTPATPSSSVPPSPVLELESAPDDTMTLGQALVSLPPVQRDTIVALLEPTFMGSAARSPAIRLEPRASTAVADGCRACERKDVTLRVCKLCVEEGRPLRAVYCSKECQARDWETRHRTEHAKHVRRSTSRTSSVQIDHPDDLSTTEKGAHRHGTTVTSDSTPSSDGTNRSGSDMFSEKQSSSSEAPPEDEKPAVTDTTVPNDPSHAASNTTA
ncbi:hypothetical protein EXIGLDRAFT_769799 [Exidia glandulosa HHB12029]|uniref:MYND-type domain-containing protein n=1 Tax=Exidia glandulosa HHB12029 TaxID=1314781 RepID=A0A165H7E1_EXIGL|nr:hypothetical protein EXIGLDRAFT_769799 [Exidia glandulosa HHB12029]